MWPIGGVLAAAATPVPQDPQLAIILAIIGLLSAVGVVAVGGFFTLRTAKASRTEPSPPSPVPAQGANQADVAFIRERVAVLERRADDNDERDDIQDKRLEQIERSKDHDHPGWRRL